MKEHRRKLTPEFKDFVAAGKIEFPFDYFVFRCSAWFQGIIEKHLPWLLGSGYYRAKQIIRQE